MLYDFSSFFAIKTALDFRSWLPSFFSLLTAEF